MNYYRRFPGDYIRDTLDFTMGEDGAYTRLLDWQYANERQITDLRHAFDISRAKNRHDRDAVRRIYKDYFPNGWNPRVKEELSKAESRRQHAKTAANSRWESMPGASGEYAPSNAPSTAPSNAQTMQSHTPYSKHQEREVFEVEAVDRSSTNTVENSGKNGTAAAALSIEEISEAFAAINTRPIGSNEFRIIFTLAAKNVSTCWTDVMEATILAAQESGVTVPREFFLIKREIEQVEVKNSFKRTPL